MIKIKKIRFKNKYKIKNENRKMGNKFKNIRIEIQNLGSVND